MACNHPHHGFKTGLKTDNGNDMLVIDWRDSCAEYEYFLPVAFAEKKLGEKIPYNRDFMKIVNGDMMLIQSVMIPCGKCPACRHAKALEWALRLSIESRAHACNSFITLTYNSRNYVDDMAKCKRDFQLFMKRLRKAIYPANVRYFAVCERGEVGRRLHFHAILFGFDFNDKLVKAKRLSGRVSCSSALLSRLWSFGFSEVGSFADKAAFGYVARYCDKKINDPSADGFFLMSRRPAIGANGYSPSLYNYGKIIDNGGIFSIPRIYDKYLDKQDPDMLVAVKAARVDIGRKSALTASFFGDSFARDDILRDYVCKGSRYAIL